MILFSGFPAIRICLCRPIARFIIIERTLGIIHTTEANRQNYPAVYQHRSVSTSVAPPYVISACFPSIPTISATAAISIQTAAISSTCSLFMTRFSLLFRFDAILPQNRIRYSLQSRSLSIKRSFDSACFSVFDTVDCATFKTVAALFCDKPL